MKNYTNLKKLEKLERKQESSSYKSKRLIQDNFRYLEFIEAFLPKPKVERVSNINHRLPGIYNIEKS